MPNNDSPLIGISELIEQSVKNPPKPVLDGLLNENEIFGLHGLPESFKTVFCLQVAESLALGSSLLGIWRVPHKRRVLLFETEMSAPALGLRLGHIYAHTPIPPGIWFATELLLKSFQRAVGLKDKFAVLRDWVEGVAAEAVIIDTCNPFFRGRESANDETSAGGFFDLLTALPAPIKMFVRHNHKRRKEDSDADAAGKIRGSGQFADVADLLVELRRKDKRTQEAVLSVTKFRNGTKPEDINLWFDSGKCRLVSVPPVVHLLKDGPLRREELLEHLERRFSIGQRTGDEMCQQEEPYLIQRHLGHSVAFEINLETAVDAPWCSRLISSDNTYNICKVA